MVSYDSLLAVCKEVNTLSAFVVDDFLMYYVARQEGLEREMDQRLARSARLRRDFSPAG